MIGKIKKRLKKTLPAPVKRWLYAGGMLKEYLPAPGEIAWGDLKRTSPFSTRFGYDRGGPVDRYYIEDFLSRHADDIRGDVLEIGDNSYTLLFGKDRVRRSDILHVDENNSSATITGDLSRLPHVPAHSFDCIILTQTLHLIYDHKAALETCLRILKDEGTLLMTVPGITNIDQGEWEKTWYWSFTPSSVRRMLSAVFGSEHIALSCYGNVLSATAFLYGLGVDEISKKEKDFYDPHYPVIIAAAARKKASL